MQLVPTIAKYDTNIGVGVLCAFQSQARASLRLVALHPLSPISAMAEIGERGYNASMLHRNQFNYKGVKVNAFGLPIFGNNSKRKTKDATKEAKRVYHTCFLSSFKKDAPKNLIVMYDIPHGLKIERDWLRRQLIKFGYVMIQKSVWVGPSPLPKDFIHYTKEIKIGDKFVTYKLAKPYNSTISAMA